MFSSSLTKLAILLSLGATACGSTTIHTTPITLDPTKPVHGAVYYLPKALLVVKLKIAVTPETKSTCGDGNRSTDCSLEANRFEIRDLAIETASVPDKDQTFLIETSGSFAVKTEFTAAFNDHGELTSSTSKSTSQALQFVATGIEAAAKVAGALAMAGNPAQNREAVAKEARRLEKAIQEVDKKIDTNWSLLNPATPVPVPAVLPKAASKPAVVPASASKLKDIVDEVTSLLALREKLVTLLKEAKTKLAEAEVVLPVACVIDPGTTFDLNACRAYQDVKTLLKSANIDVPGPLPKLTLTLQHQGGPTQPSRTGQLKTAAGFFYRIPVWYEVEAFADTGARARASVALPQLGQLALWELAEDDLRSGKTIAIELHPGLGSVKSVTLNAEPVSTDDIKSVVSAAKGLTTAKEDAELDALKRQKGKLDAERELIEAKQKLEAAKHPKPDQPDKK